MSKPKRTRADVAVVGGGPAGIASAIAAARLGARTLLVERESELGGNATQAWVHTICGLYRAAEEGDARLAHPGFPRRFAEALRDAGAAGDPVLAGRVWVLPTDPPRMARVARDLCHRTPGLEVALGKALMGAEPDEPWLLRLAGGGRIEASLVVDASGDATAAALAGAEIERAGPDELQLPSFIFRLGGVDTRTLQGFERLRVTHAVAGAARHGDLPEGCESVLVRPGGTPGQVYVTLNLPRPPDFDPLDPAQVESLTARARKWAEALAGFLRSSRDAFAGSRLLDFPARIGVRETRRVTGRASLSREDVRTGRAWDDAVAVSTWPIELWHDHRRARFEYPDKACDVPLGALVSRTHPRLGAAGRCLSASHEALGALRVIGTALATGEAVGVAAALAADRGVALADVPARDVRDAIGKLAETRP